MSMQIFASDKRTRILPKTSLANNGVSTILEGIVKEKKTGGCNCGKNHPLGK